MAEIRTAIEIVDGFTPVLNSFHKALDLVTDELTRLQQTMGDRVDMSGINAAREQLARAQAAMNAMRSKSGLDTSGVGKSASDTAQAAGAAAQASQQLGALAAQSAASMHEAARAAAQATAAINAMSDAAIKAGSALVGASNAAGNMGATAQNASNALTGAAKAAGTLSNSANNASGALNGASGAEQRLGSSAGSAKVAQDQLNESMNRGQLAAANLASRMKQAAAAYLSWQGAGAVIQASDNLTNIEARLKLVNDGTDSDQELQDKIFEVAQRTGAAYGDTAAFVAKLRMNAGDAFKTNNEAIKFAEVLQKKFSIAGTTGPEMASAMLQLTQALGSGVLRGEELNAVFEAAPNVIQSIADYMDVPIGKIRKMAGEGKLSAAIVKNALLEAAKETDAKFAAIPDSFAVVWTRFKNSAMLAFKPVLKGLNDIINSDRFKKAMNMAISLTVKLGQALTVAGESAVGAFNWVIDNIDLLAPVLAVATAALGTYVAAMVGLKAATLAAMAVTKAWHAVVVTVTTAIKVLRTVTLAFAAAASSGLFLPFIIGATLVVGIIYSLGKVIAMVTDDATDGLGAILGTFAYFAGVVTNVVGTIWNVFASLAEFIINVFKQPSYAVQALFVNLADAVLSIFATMADSVDDLLNGITKKAIGAANYMIDVMNLISRNNAQLDPYGNKIGGAQIEHIKEPEPYKNSVANARQALKDWLGPPPEDYLSFAPSVKFDAVEAYDDWAQKAYNFGAKINTKDGVNQLISDITNKAQQLKDGLTSQSSKEALNVQSLSYDALQKIAGNTGKTADALNANNEELKFLREIGEREAVYKLNTNDIRLDVTNNNSINSILDADEVINRLINNLRSSMNSMAAGDFD